MEKNLRNSFKEVYEIIQHTEESVVKRIPEYFINFLRDNMNNNYSPNMDFNSEKWKEQINDDTKAILALIYRDYIISKDEREKLIQEEIIARNRYEQELRGKYNPDNIFKNKHREDKKIINNTQLIEVKKTTWFQKILKNILKIFGK